MDITGVTALVEENRQRVLNVATELGLKNAAVNHIQEEDGVSLSWDGKDDQRLSFDILWKVFHQTYGSGYESLSSHIEQEIARFN